MLTIGKLGGEGDIGAYYARDDYYGGDATALDDEALDLQAIHSEGDLAGGTAAVAPAGPGAVSGSGDAAGRGAQAAGAGVTSSEGRVDSGSLVVSPSPDQQQASRNKGQWFGKGAASLGLSGGVDPDQLNDILKGRLPNGVVLGKAGARGSGEREHTPGWDLTFSAPKSLSMLSEIVGDRALFKMHNAAVKEAVTWIEQEAATVRVKNGFLGTRREATGNLLVALFQHDVSREQDPNLHTHALTLNVTQREDGRWRSLDSPALYDHKMAGGLVYRAALARMVQDLAGWSIDKTHADGRWELSQISDEQIEAFSTRRKQIEARLDDWKAEGAEHSARAALLTRSRKTIADLPELREAWRCKAESMCLDVDQASRRGQPVARESMNEIEEGRLLRSAVDRLSEREATFSHARLVAGVLAEGMGRIDVSAAESIIARSERYRGIELYAARLGDQKAWTTPKALEQEKRIEAVIGQGIASVDPVAKRKDVAAYLKAVRKTDARPPNENQQKAIELVTTSRDQFVGIVGRPGTGKTTMLTHANRILEERGFQVIGMAPNGAAAKELQRGAGIKASRTLASHLSRTGRRIAELKAMSPAARQEALEDIKKEVWVLDEASQANNKDLRRLTTFARLTGARVVMVGDPAQLGAIDAGKPFDRLLTETRMKRVELTELLRQQHAPDKQRVQHAIDRNIQAAMEMLRSHTVIETDQFAREAEMVRHWATSPDRDNTVMISLKNEVKTRLNDLARDVLRGEGKLTSETPAKQLFPVFGQKADRVSATSYKKGDVILFQSGSKSRGISGRTYWHVTEVVTRRGQNQITISNGAELRTLDPKTVANTMRASEHFRPRDTTVAVGDQIVWGKNDRQRGLLNGTRLEVKAIEARQMHATDEDGQSFAIPLDDKRENQHWQHAYATSLYKSQGATHTHVLQDAPVADAKLLDHHGLVVSVSRHRDTLTYFTDDFEALQRKVIFNQGDKTSAMEGAARQRVHQLAGRLKNIYERFQSGRTTSGLEQEVRQSSSTEPKRIEQDVSERWPASDRSFNRFGAGDPISESRDRSQEPSPTPARSSDRHAEPNR